MPKPKTQKSFNPGIALWNIFCANDSAFCNAVSANEGTNWLTTNKKDETVKAADWLRELADQMESEVK